MNTRKDRIERAGENSESFLDELFESLERGALEGYKSEIVEGNIYMWPQRDMHWQITLAIIRQLHPTYPDRCVKSDVRIDYPGPLNGFASDVTLVAEDAEMTSAGLWRHEDVEFVAEVISEGMAQKDYGPKKTAYAVAEVPLYLIADPYQDKCHLYTQPKNGDYLTRLSVAFGTDISIPLLGLTLKTDEFPGDR